MLRCSALFVVFLLSCSAFSIVKSEINTGWRMKKWNMHASRRSSNWTVLETIIDQPINPGFFKVA